jgi:GT2 family glycosyltransferase
MISIILNVGPAPRVKMLHRCLPQTFARAGWQDIEFLVCDNGTNSHEVADLIQALNPVYFRRNRENQGNYQMLNQLVLRASGEYIAYIAGDIEYPTQWLKKLVTAAAVIPETGMVGFYCVGKDHGTPEVRNGIAIKVVKGAVFGGGLWSRSLHDRIGYFYEGYGKYGLGDSDWGLRIRQTGLLNYFVGDDVSVHHGDDVDADSAYRQMKWEILHTALSHFSARKQQIQAGNVYVPPPERTEADLQ